MRRLSWPRIVAVMIKEIIQMRRDRLTFAMIIGVLVGTYSSIFVASPVLTLLATDDMRNPPQAEASRKKKEGGRPREGVPA